VTITDNFTQLSPVIDVRQNYHRPVIRLDLGPQFLSRDFGLWVWAHGVVLDSSRLAHGQCLRRSVRRLGFGPST
jgi:hypothetical protein